MPNFIVIIPARYGASRLPGKPLLDLVGKPVIAHVIDCANKSGATQVVVATDDTRIQQVAEAYGSRVVMTRQDHLSGTDRIAEAIEILKLGGDEIVINVQGDEPDMPPALIEQMATALAQKKDVNLCTACTPLDSQELVNDANVVKVVRDKNDFALYFSRAPVAFDRDANGQYAYRRHLGIYGYRAAFVGEFSAAPVCALEQTEKLEQLRALYMGEKIYCPDAVVAPGIGIDTPQDIARARAHFSSDHGE